MESELSLYAKEKAEKRIASAITLGTKIQDFKVRFSFYMICAVFLYIHAQ